MAPAEPYRPAVQGKNMQRHFGQVSGARAPTLVRSAVALALSSRSVFLCVVFSGGAALPAHAQVSSPAIQEVVVTARRREENMQDVPVAVSAISGAMIEQAHLPDTTQLAQFVPNVVFDNIEAGTPAGGAFSIRGISYQDVEKTFDPTVLVMVDGIVRGSGTGQTMSLLDVKNIEVLRGPQGTLFGKNAVGGIINITRRAPETGSVFGAVAAAAGNYGTQNVDGYLNLGGSNVALKLTAARHDHDGYFPNRTLQRDEGARTEEDYGVALLWPVTEDFSLKFSYDYKDIEGSPAPTLNISDRRAAGPGGDLLCSAFGQCAPGPGQTQAGDPFVNMGRRAAELSYEEHFAVTEANWDFAKDYRLTYLFGYLNSDDYIAFDSDGSPIDFFAIHRNGDYTQKSHELRVSRSGEAYNWQAGVYAWDSNSSDLQVYELTNYNDAFSGSSSSASVFGEGDIRFAQRWVATGGFRWIEETKEIFKPALGGGGERTDSDVIWRAGLRFEANDDLMAYFTYSTGFRSGGFSARASTLDVLQKGEAPETLENFELGVKTEWFDSRLRMNATVFHMLYKDMQIESNIPCPACGTGGQQTAVLNVGQATINGAELELSGQVADSWRLSGTVGLLDSEYDRFYTDLLGTGTPSDFSNLPLRRAPEATYSVQSINDLPVPIGELSFFIGYNWTSDYAGTINDHPGTHIDAFGMLNSSLTYKYSKNWNVAVFGNNLTDEGAFTHTYAVGPTPQGGSLWKFANPRVPRTYGLKVTYRYGE
jgi:iron complex outermembrane receptor protein